MTKQTIILPRGLILRTQHTADRAQVSLDELVVDILSIYASEPNCASQPMLPMQGQPDMTVTLDLEADLCSRAMALHPNAAHIGDVIARALCAHFDTLDGEDAPLKTYVELPRDTFEKLAAAAVRYKIPTAAIIRRVLADFVYDPHSNKDDISIPQDANPYKGSCAIGPSIMAQLTHVLRRHDRPNLPADSTILIQRAVQRFVDKEFPADIQNKPQDTAKNQTSATGLSEFMTPAMREKSRRLRL